MQESFCKTRLSRCLCVLMGALVLGMLWRFRGTHGWGSESGILNSGFIFTMFLVIITGGNARTNPFRIALNSFLFILTTPAWGTLLNQMRGMISSGPDPIYYGVSPASGVFMMLMLGFSIAGLFGIMTGFMFSDSKLKAWHYVLLVAALYAVTYLFKAGPAHQIIRLVQPQTIDHFNSSLVANGVDCGVFKAYMSHFDNMEWGRSIIGGRNYVAEVGTISLAVATMVCILLTRFVIKDRRAARIGLLTALSFAFAITFANLFFVFFSNTGKPALIESQRIFAWGCWEYFTGFIAGALVTLIVMKLGTCDNGHDGSADFIPLRMRNFLGFAGTMAVLCYNIIRPIILRYEKGALQHPAVVAAITIAVLVVAIYGVRSRFDVSRMDGVRFSKITLLWLVLLQSVIYFFGDDKIYLSVGELDNFCTLISCIPVLVLDYLLVRKQFKVLK